jgi:hypothetical protein
LRAAKYLDSVSRPVSVDLVHRLKLLHNRCIFFGTKRAR